MNFAESLGRLFFNFVLIAILRSSSLLFYHTTLIGLKVSWIIMVLVSGC